MKTESLAAFRWYQKPDRGQGLGHGRAVSFTPRFSEVFSRQLNLVNRFNGFQFESRLNGYETNILGGHLAEARCE